MNKRKGFTLIELLAVIVILALIALIVTPIMMGVIEDSKKGAAERSAENYKSAVETAAARQLMRGTELEGEYVIQEDGNLCPISGCGQNNSKKVAIEVSGNKPQGGSITIKDGQVLDGSVLEVYDYVVNIVDRSGKVGEFGEKTIGNSIKYDPVANAKCTTGATCYNWYVLDGNETEYAYVSLIMDRNIGNNVAWCNDETLCKINNAWNNSAGPITAMNYLKEQTSNWTVSAKLPTYDQIFNVKGRTDFESAKWLYDYLHMTEHPETGVHGYWASTPDAYNSNNAWYVRRVGNLSSGDVNNVYNYGVRPVITVLKSNLSS